MRYLNFKKIKDTLHIKVLLRLLGTKMYLLSFTSLVVVSRGWIVV